MDEVFIICIAGTLCRLPRLGAVRIHSELSCFAPRLLLPPPRFFFLPRKLDGCFLSSVVPLFVVIFMRTPNRIFLVENRRSFNVWRKRTWDLGGDWKEREATKTPGSGGWATERAIKYCCRVRASCLIFSIT